MSFISLLRPPIDPLRDALPAPPSAHAPDSGSLYRRQREAAGGVEASHRESVGEDVWGRSDGDRGGSAYIQTTLGGNSLLSSVGKQDSQRTEGVPLLKPPLSKLDNSMPTVHAQTYIYGIELNDSVALTCWMIYIDGDTLYRSVKERNANKLCLAK